MKVSVIIPVFDGERYLRRAVESVMATGYSDLEVLIIDDGSTDGSLGVAVQIEQESRGTVRLLQHQGGANRGVSASRNLGIRESRGEAVSFLDADDLVLPHRFQLAMALLAADPALDGVYETCKVEHADGFSDELDGDELFGVKEPLRGTALLRHLLETSSPWSTSAITLRRSVFERCGYFPEGVRVAEDCHLWYRLAAVANLVPGALGVPVSVYWRHERNTYVPAPERRLDMVRVMVDVWRWSRHAEIATDRRQALVPGMRTYLWRSLVSVRSAGRRDLAWAIFWAVARCGALPLLADRRVLRQAVSMIHGLCRRGAPRA